MSPVQSRTCKSWMAFGLRLINMTLSLDCFLSRMDTTLPWFGVRASATALNSATVMFRSSRGVACRNPLYRTTVRGNKSIDDSTWACSGWERWSSTDVLTIELMTSGKKNSRMGAWQICFFAELLAQFSLRIHLKLWVNGSVDAIENVIANLQLVKQLEGDDKGNDTL